MDGSGFYSDLSTYQIFLKESIDTAQLNVNVVSCDGELPDGVYALERVISSRKRGSVSSETLHVIAILYDNMHMNA